MLREQAIADAAEARDVVLQRVLVRYGSAGLRLVVEVGGVVGRGEKMIFVQQLEEHRLEARRVDDDDHVTINSRSGVGDQRSATSDAKPTSRRETEANDPQQP